MGRGDSSEFPLTTNPMRHVGTISDGQLAGKGVGNPWERVSLSPLQLSPNLLHQNSICTHVCGLRCAPTGDPSIFWQAAASGSLAEK